jgi:hypothetical protein
MNKATALEFVTPSGHQEALEVLGQHKVMLDTFPYSSGLTAQEASAMGVQVKAKAGPILRTPLRPTGHLICRRSIEWRNAIQKTPPKSPIARPR